MSYTDFDKNLSLKGKVAIVTGAAQGIGKAIAELFAEKGANIVLVDLSKNKMKEVADSLKKYEVDTLTLNYDITKSENSKKIAEESVEEFGKIDILVNCAGVALLEKAKDYSEEDWDKTMDVNLKAPFLLSKEVGNKMIKENYGKIINIASQAGIIALDKHIAYTTSKAGIIGMTKALALEWAEYNININAVSPTVILTELGKKAWAGEVGERMKEKIPAKRFGYPEEVAFSVLYLASDASSLVNGENFVIDGGYSIK